MSMDGTARVPAASRMSIQEWMTLSFGHSRKSYVQSAVDLAWMLTKRLRQVMDAADDDLNLDDIATDNIIILIDRSSKRPSVKSVKFRSPPSGENTNLLSPGSLQAKRNTIPPHTRAVCAALGKLLLQLFSRGQSGSQGNSCHSSDEKKTACVQNDDHAVPPAAKRKAAMSANGPISATANNLLLELGMPLSVCRLVCDLLDAEIEPRVDFALASLDEALWDLSSMKRHPKSFLFDRTCPERALVDTGLFGNNNKQILGREKEIDALLALKRKVSHHVCRNDSVSNQRGFLCEAVYLKGFPGNGKSSLLHSLVHVCSEEHWFVLGCKFDKCMDVNVAKAFDDFFRKWSHLAESPNGDDSSLKSNLSTGKTVFNSMAESFQSICRAILSTIDIDGLMYLCDIVPNLRKLFPLIASSHNSFSQDGISSMDKVGSAKKRHLSLFRALLKSICSAGLPVLFILDDLQWSDHFAMDFFADFVDQDSNQEGGMLIAGTYRSNEVNENDDLIKTIDSMKKSGRVNVTILPIEELHKLHCTELISSKLCLPWRYTQELAWLVHTKTRGNPFSIVQFMKTVIQNKMVEFSVRSRRWEWDCDTVQMQSISESAAEMLIARFSQLPPKLIQTVKIISCIGCQIEEATIQWLDQRCDILPYNMLDEMHDAVQAGLLENAGPVYQFTHDIIHQTIYELIPPKNRTLLHKTIAKHLLKSSSPSTSIHLLAADQITRFCKAGHLNSEERPLYARFIERAAKFAVASSNFEQAQSFIDLGITLLGPGHWEDEYELSLNLYEMSATVCYKRGDVETLSTSLDAIMSHAKSFDDSLTASSMLVQLLARSSKFSEAMSNCLIILHKLGEDFPDISCSCVVNELSSLLKTTLGNDNISRDQFKLLPPMVDKSRLSAMKFMNLLCRIGLIAKPMLVPLLSCRMMRLTMDYGFCEESIVGLANVAYSVFTFTEDFALASHIGRVCDALIDETPKKHILRSRLCHELTAFKIFTVSPDSMVSILSELYNSSMMAGDVENAVILRWNSCSLAFFTGREALSTVSKHLVMCEKEADKYQQENMLYCTMAYLNTLGFLGASVEIEMKSFDEIGEIAKAASNAFLVWQSGIAKTAGEFFMREYFSLIDQCEKQSSSQHKRLLHVMLSFYEGIASFSMARDTKQAKWRSLGEKSLKNMANMVKMNSLFGTFCSLLEAERHYSDGDMGSAELSYKASIESAEQYQMTNLGALAHELYGIFCIENKFLLRGVRQLRSARDKYQKWGATKKAHQLKLLIDLVDLSYWQKLQPA